MRPDYDGPMDEPIARAADHEFGFDFERPAVLEVERVGSGRVETAEKLVAQSVVALVKSGASIGEAALACGQTLESLKGNSLARQQLRQLRADYDLEAEELKALVKAMAAKIALTGEDGDKIKALKLIAEMPGVDLVMSRNVNIAVGVFSDETKNVLAGIDPNEKET